MEFVRLLGPYGESRTATKSVDCHPSFPVELEAMAAWNMAEPAVGVLEIGGLEPKRGDDRRDVQMAKRVARRYFVFQSWHHSLLTKEPRSPQPFGEQRVPAPHVRMDAFFSWTRTAMRDARHGQGRRALFTLGLRLTRFAAVPQSFPWRRPPHPRSKSGAL